MKTAPMTRPAQASQPAPQPAAPQIPPIASEAPPAGVSAEEAALIGAANPDALQALADERAKVPVQPAPPTDAEMAAAAQEASRLRNAQIENEAAARAAAAKASLMHVLDLSAQGEEVRIHEMMVDGLVRQFKFRRAIPTALPPYIAVKFLKYTDSFKQTDEDGELIPFQNTPKQPHELEAGEKFKLDRNATIARYDELHTPALQLRVLQIEGGERFRDSKDRASMVNFIIEKTEERQRKNMGVEGGLGIEEFTPPPENDSVFHGGDWH